MLCIPGPITRGELESQIFTRLDEDMDGYLSEKDMQHLAVVEGKHADNDKVWKLEYEAMTKQFGIPKEGVNEELFKSIVEEGYAMGHVGFYTMVQWAALLENLDRESVLARLIFGHLDEDHDGVINKAELRNFARLSGNPVLMTLRGHEFGIAEGGATFDQFLRYINKENNHGRKVTLYVLGRVLSQLVDEDPRWRYTRLIFHALDSNRDGYLSAHELHRFSLLLDTAHTAEETQHANPFATAFRDLVIDNVAAKGNFDAVAFGKFLRADARLFSLEKLEMVLAKLEADKKMAPYYATPSPSPADATASEPEAGSEQGLKKSDPEGWNLPGQVDMSRMKPYGEVKDDAATTSALPGTLEESSDASPSEAPVAKPMTEAPVAAQAPTRRPFLPTLPSRTHQASDQIQPPAVDEEEAENFANGKPTQKSQVDLPSWNSVLKSILLGFGAFLGALGTAALCVFVSIRSTRSSSGPLMSSSQPSAQDGAAGRGGRQSSWHGAAHFDRLPTSDDTSGLLTNVRNSQNKYEPVRTDQEADRSPSVDGPGGL